VRADPQLSADQARRLAALVRIARNKPEGVAKTEEANRRTSRGKWRLARFSLYMLDVELMGVEHWSEAEVALDELIALSKAKGECTFSAKLGQGELGA
jgi:hypothetical protein